MCRLRMHEERSTIGVFSLFGGRGRVLKCTFYKIIISSGWLSSIRHRRENCERRRADFSSSLWLSFSLSMPRNWPCLPNSEPFHSLCLSRGVLQSESENERKSSINFPPRLCKSWGKEKAQLSREITLFCTWIASLNLEVELRTSSERRCLQWRKLGNT